MRILIVRTSALGDVVHCLPVLTALRRHLPQAHIGWVVEAAMAPVLDGHPDLDERIEVRLRSWRRGPWRSENRRGFWNLFRQLRGFRADVVLDLMGNHKGGALAWLAGAGRSLGLARAHRREPSSALWIREGIEPYGPHAVDRALSVLDGLELPREPADFDGDKLFAQPPSDATRELLDTADTPFLLLSPGAGWGNKTYPASWWGRVARRLHEQAGLCTWVTGGPGEEGLLVEVTDAGGEAIRSIGVTDLPTFAHLARASRLMLGGDTGPLHLAHALGTPVLCVMGPTDPQRHGPYGSEEHSLVHRLPCSFCYKRFPEPKGCLLTLPPRRVAEAAARLLERGDAV